MKKKERAAKKRIGGLRYAVLLAAAAVLGGMTLSCAGFPPEQGSRENRDDGGWTIVLSGVREDAVTAAEFNQAKEHSSHYQRLVLEKSGEEHTYRAMPFWYLAAMVDGNDAEHPWILDRAAWKEGYDITLTASDGYAVTFSTDEVEAEALYLADERDGEPVSPRIVGEVPGNLRIKGLERIELGLGEPAGEEAFALEVDVNGETASYTLEELAQSPFYVEGQGSYTTSAGTTHTHRYGGVAMAGFLNSRVKLTPESTVKVEAMDGYVMSYGAGQLMDKSGGVWIMAFRSDGERMPLDPGYLRTVKVRPAGTDGAVPNIDGHSSARMIAKVSVSGEPYREYELLIRGRMDNTLDRQTIQSGVSCHARTVEFRDKKSGSLESYTGIPLWMLLAYGDDPDHAPHRQKDKSIRSYKEQAAQAGYRVRITASDGYSVTLDSRELNRNDDVILAAQKGGETLPEREWPLTLVWDQNAEPVPEGIKAVRNITEIDLLFD